MNKLFANQKVTKAWKIIRPWIIFLIILLVLRLTNAFTGISVVASSALMKTGIMDIRVEPAPNEESFNYNFSIKDRQGKTIEIDQFKGKTIFLNLWATWCGPCRAEMPSIQGLYDKVDKDKVVFVILDWYEEPGKVSKFLDDKKFTFPVYFIASKVPEQLNVPSIPTTFVISPEGKIVTKKAGSANYDTKKFKDFLEALK